MTKYNKTPEEGWRVQWLKHCEYNQVENYHIATNKT